MREPKTPKLTEAFGVNVPLMVTLTYGFGVALAAFAGVLAAPILQVQPLMGSNLIIVVFAVVVIGGMGSIMGSILTGLGLGVIEGFTRVFYPEASATVVFVIMAIVLAAAPRRLVRQGEVGEAVVKANKEFTIFLALLVLVALLPAVRCVSGVRDEGDAATRCLRARSIC